MLGYKGSRPRYGSHAQGAQRLMQEASRKSSHKCIIASGDGTTAVEHAERAV